MYLDGPDRAIVRKRDFTSVQFYSAGFFSHGGLEAPEKGAPGPRLKLYRPLSFLLCVTLARVLTWTTIVVLRFHAPPTGVHYMNLAPGDLRLGCHAVRQKRWLNT
jgi:hypothetical protein